MPPESPEFQNYLTRHYAHLGDQAKHRAGKKRQLLRTYGRLLPEDRTAEMLEIGPGYGQLIEMLRRDLGYANVTAIDLSREVVDFCDRALPGSTRFVVDPIADLEASPERYQRVFALHVLEHMPKAVAMPFLRAIRTALRPGGRLVIEVPNMANLFTGVYLRYADWTHEAGYAESSLRHLLETAGYAEVQCFEEAIPVESVTGALAAVFRSGARGLQRIVYRGYRLPVPQVLTPSLCATATRAAESR